jgi:hypothetical protein
LLTKSNTQLKIFDINGREIEVLVPEKQLNAGEYSFTWKTFNIMNGIYIYQLQIGNEIVTKKLTIQK